MKGFVGNPDINKEYRDFLMSAKIPLVASGTIVPVVVCEGYVPTVEYFEADFPDTDPIELYQVPENMRVYFESISFQVHSNVTFESIRLEDPNGSGLLHRVLQINSVDTFPSGERFNRKLGFELPEGWKIWYYISARAGANASSGTLHIKKRRG